MNDSTDLCIIGGGAAGLASAIFAAQAASSPRRITLLEATGNLGTKIMVSGGGRCNITHDHVTPADYNGSPNIVRNILAAFDSAATIRWFAALGVTLKREETGKLYPTTDSAATVRAALVNRCHELGVTIRTTAKVHRILPPAAIRQQFLLEHTHGNVTATHLILATGGRSLPKSGSDGSGWALARELGHDITPTHQALAPLVLDSSFFHASLSGLTMEVELSTFAQGKLLDRRTHSMVWTHFGISGPAAMDASRHWTQAHDLGQQPRLLCNLLPGETFSSLESSLLAITTARPRAAILTLLSTRLPERIAAVLLGFAAINPSTPAGQLPRESRRALVHLLTALPLPVVGPRGWNYAEVTAGGIPLNQINYRTMESRRVPGLYLVGEILDCDGRIGGFNFQWAWATAHLAGRAAIASL